MRPYFAPRPQQSDPARPVEEPVDAAALRAAWNVLVAAHRPFWPGGIATAEDLKGLRRRLSHRFGLTEAEIEAVVSPAL